MNSITFLDSSNFVLIGTQNKLLGVTISDPFLVFFKMKSSEPCRIFEPIFSELSTIDKRVSYGILDVERYKNVVAQSRSTSTPITSVPLVILYLGGRPHAKYNGSKNVASMQTFITEMFKTQLPPKSFQAPNTGMYGGPAQPNMAQVQGKNKNMPDIGRAPSMKGVLKGSQNPAGYSSGGNYVEDEEHPRLMIPDSVTPWNAPWEAELQNDY